MKKFNIISYTKMNGSIPEKKFILSLLSKMQAKVLVEMDLLAEYGNELDGKYTKYLEDGIFELRIKQASNITRILYFFYINKNITQLSHHHSNENN